MRTPNRVEVAAGAALFAAYPAFAVAQNHDLIGHQIYHWGTEGVTVVVLTNLVWWGTVNSPAATWARGRAGKAWHRLTTLRRPPLPPPPLRVGETGQTPPSATQAKPKHPGSCQCHGDGTVPCPFQTAPTEV
jgi:hypothetical protein